MQQLLSNEGRYQKIEAIAREKWGEDWLDHFPEAEKILEEREAKEAEGITRIMANARPTISRAERRRREKEEMKEAEAAARLERKQRMANDPYIPKKKKR